MVLVPFDAPLLPPIQLRRRRAWMLGHQPVSGALEHSRYLTVPLAKTGDSFSSSSINRARDHSLPL